MCLILQTAPLLERLHRGSGVPSLHTLSRDPERILCERAVYPLGVSGPRHAHPPPSRVSTPTSRARTPRPGVVLGLSRPSAALSWMPQPLHHRPASTLGEMAVWLQRA